MSWQNLVHAHTVQGHPTILVMIASFRDFQCPETIAQAFDHAHLPMRIFVAAVEERMAPEDDHVPRCMPTQRECRLQALQRGARPTTSLCTRRQQVRTMSLDARIAVGPTYPRHVLSRMFRGEAFVLQIDAHTHFVRGWDDNLIGQWRAADNEMAMLTAYPTDSSNATDPVTHYARTNATRPIMCVSEFKDGIITHGAQPMTAPTGEKMPTIQPFWAAGFSFARGHWAWRVPYDPFLPMIFQGEEISMAVRAWTHGYDFYAPMHSAVFHEYEKFSPRRQARSKRTPRFEATSKPNATRYAAAMERLKTLIHLEADQHVLPDHARSGAQTVDGSTRYGLGTTRPVEWFYSIFEVDRDKRVIKVLCDVLQRPQTMDAIAHYTHPINGINYAAAMADGFHFGKMVSALMYNDANTSIELWWLPLGQQKPGADAVLTGKIPPGTAYRITGHLGDHYRIKGVCQGSVALTRNDEVFHLCANASPHAALVASAVVTTTPASTTEAASRSHALELPSSARFALNCTLFRAREQQQQPTVVAAAPTSVANSDPSQAIRLKYLPVANGPAANPLLCDELAVSGSNSPDGEDLPLLRSLDVQAPWFGSPRLFCAVYTTSALKEQSEYAASTWMPFCDGSLLASDVADSSLPSVLLSGSIKPNAPEVYTDLWRKNVKVYKHLMASHPGYDYYLVCGPDTYVLVGSLKAFLANPGRSYDSMHARGAPLFFGRRWIRPWEKLPFNSGGAGYLVNVHALRCLVDHIDEPECKADISTGEEDVLISRCLAYKCNATALETRDDAMRERFHPFTPHMQHRVVAAQEYRTMTQDWYQQYSKAFGLKYGDDCCSPSSVSFHYVKKSHMQRLHAYLHQCRSRCTSGTMAGTTARARLATTGKGSDEDDMKTNCSAEPMHMQVDAAAAANAALPASHRPKALVTGAAGFIGSHVAEFCASRMKLRVIAVDDFSGGFMRNVWPITALGGVFVRGDVSNDTFVRELFLSNGPFDYVFHLAAYAAEGLSHYIRGYNYANNLLASTYLVNAAIRQRPQMVRRYVFTSSIAAFGAVDDPSELPMTERTLQRPEDPYGVAKHSVELDLKAAAHMFGLEYTVFYPHNVYGPRQNIADKFRNAVGIFMNQILNGEPMTIFGSGAQKRALSYIDDVAHPIAASVLFPSAVNTAFFVGSDTPHTISYLAAQVAKAMKRPNHPIVHLDARKEVEEAYASHTKIRCHLRPPSTVNLRSGLERTAAYVLKIGGFQPAGYTKIELYMNLPPSWRDWLNASG